jgi:hypothetical protein
VRNALKSSPGRDALSALSARGGESHRGLVTLAHAVEAWVEDGRREPLARWFRREINAEGIPRQIPVQEWIVILARLAEARRRAERAWPASHFNPGVKGLFRSTLRFSRPNGSAVFGDAPCDVPRVVLRDWAEHLADRSLTTVVDRWFPHGKGNAGAPPLPAYSSSDSPLAMLRADWSPEGDFLAIDHRGAGGTSLVELLGRGRTWLGPTWSSVTEGAPTTQARPLRWVSDSAADLVEWTFRVGKVRVIRTALLLRGRRLALLADQVEGPVAVASMRIALPEGVAAQPVLGSRGLVLARRRGRLAARVFPIGLPHLPSSQERGELTAAAGELDLCQRLEGGKCWLPLVASWEPRRDRRSVSWRRLTVTERSQVCPPEVAFAARVSWARDETWVIYRSLARPALRSFLGHQTRARFLVGLFTKAGILEPILQLDD